MSQASQFGKPDESAEAWRGDKRRLQAAIASPNFSKCLITVPSVVECSLRRGVTTRIANVKRTGGVAIIESLGVSSFHCTVGHAASRRRGDDTKALRKFVQYFGTAQNGMVVDSPRQPLACPTDSVLLSRTLATTFHAPVMHPFAVHVVLDARGAGRVLR